MKQKTFEKYLFGAILFACIVALIFLATAKAQDSTKTQPPVDDRRKIIGEIKTVFGSDGRPVNQSQTAKGFHRVSGSLKLASGRGTINLNTRTAEGRQDVSFISRATYKGSVTITDTTNTKTYTVYPRTASMAVIVSSDTSDTATVGYVLEGE